MRLPGGPSLVSHERLTPTTQSATDERQVRERDDKQRPVGGRQEESGLVLCCVVLCRVVCCVVFSCAVPRRCWRCGLTKVLSRPWVRPPLPSLSGRRRCSVSSRALPTAPPSPERSDGTTRPAHDRTPDNINGNHNNTTRTQQTSGRRGRQEGGKSERRGEESRGERGERTANEMRGEGAR